MIELLIKNHLEKELKVSVLLEQKIEQGEYIVFERIGSSKNNQLIGTNFAFQSYADTMFEACKLNNRLKEAVESLISHDEIVSITLNSDYNFTDTQTKKFRYQAIYEFKHY